MILRRSSGQAQSWFLGLLVAAAIVAMMAVAEGPWSDVAREGAEAATPCTSDPQCVCCVSPIAAYSVSAASAAEPQQECTLRVARVSDGDTFHARTIAIIGSRAIEEDSGFRLARVYAPERKEPDYPKAKAELQQLIEGKLVAVVLTHPSGSKSWREKYGRFFVEVYLCTPGGNVSVNDAMRAAGWVDKGRGVPKK